MKFPCWWTNSNPRLKFTSEVPVNKPSSFLMLLLPPLIIDFLLTGIRNKPGLVDTSTSTLISLYDIKICSYISCRSCHLTLKPSIPSTKHKEDSTDFKQLRLSN